MAVRRTCATSPSLPKRYAVVYIVYFLLHVFCFVGVDDVDFSRYPDKTYQLDWIRYYLECQAEHNGGAVSDITDRDVEDCYVKANKFALVNEMEHVKTNKKTHAPREDSDQPGNSPSLIRALAVRLKMIWVLSYPLRTHQRLIRLGKCPC